MLRLNSNARIMVLHVTPILNNNFRFWGLKGMALSASITAGIILASIVFILLFAAIALHYLNKSSERIEEEVGASDVEDLSRRIVPSWLRLLHYSDTDRSSRGNMSSFPFTDSMNPMNEMTEGVRTSMASTLCPTIPPTPAAAAAAAPVVTTSSR